jgi:hypothetical protein
MLNEVKQVRGGGNANCLPFSPPPHRFLALSFPKIGIQFPIETRGVVMSSSRRTSHAGATLGLGGLEQFNVPVKRPGPGILTRTLQQDIEDAKKFSPKDLVENAVSENAIVIRTSPITGKITVRYLVGKDKGREMDCKPSFFTIIKKPAP